RLGMGPGPLGCFDCNHDDGRRPGGPGMAAAETWRLRPGGRSQLGALPGMLRVGDIALGAGKPSPGDVHLFSVLRSQMTTAPIPRSDFGASFAPDLRRLIHALRLLLVSAAPIALLMLAILFSVHLLYLRDPTRTRINRYLSLDYMIVLEQLKRAATVSRPDIGLIGDSSCLMGVDAARLTARLGRSAESFCSLAF